nr:acyl-CoA dehydrogenase family protein [Oceanococcus sp. HetDA_MAG_MS8]
MIQLEQPRKFRALVNQAHQVAQEVFRPISRKYDRAEHSYPKELNMLAALLDGMNDSASDGGAGAAGLAQSSPSDGEVRNGANMNTVLGLIELCWGDVGLALSLPRQGLGNAAIAAVASPEQKKRLAGCWAAMAITEPGAGSDSAAIRTTAVKDGDDYVINGEKIYVTAGGRCDHVVVWASLDPSKGRAAIKSFVVPKDTPGMELVRLDHKLGIRASDTATLRFTDCRVPAENLLGTADIDTKKGFGGVMQTFDNTRPVVAGMAVGLGRAALERTRELLEAAGFNCDYRQHRWRQAAATAELQRLEAEWDAARLLTLRAAWMADNSQPNSLEASMSKAKAGRMVTEVTQKCAEIASSLGYAEDELLEKWARDAKILDIFEGTQQIQLLIVARRVLELSSAQLT